MDWNLQKQERGGDYWFDGQFYATRGVNDAVPLPDLVKMLNILQAEARKKNGIDYLQVFVHASTGRKLWFIDQLTRAIVNGGEFAESEHYCTALWPEEY